MLNFEEFQNLHLKPKLSFLMKYSLIFTNSPYENHENYIKTNSQKSGNLPVIIFVIFPPKMKIKNESFDVSSNSA